ncbi:hypothetical protein pipiens_012860 [Culex pipiens pipiens]|uniref:F-box domain-containing protein n=1 Tax=Culex pipiens pipiens TaxID=38569 RepID=A0ABD1D0N6_CULPP
MSAPNQTAIAVGSSIFARVSGELLTCAMNRRTKRPTKLPNEVWLNIFGHLTPLQLLTARLVCRNWNRLVGNSSKLLDQYKVTVPAANDAVVRWKHVATSRYTTVKVSSFTTGMIPTVPLTTVRSLSLENPWITARQMVKMFSFLPNLQHLSVVAVANVNYGLYETLPAVQLDRLEWLDLDLGEKDGFLGVFQNNCPRLKGLQVKMAIKKYLEAPYGSKLLDLINSTRNTLMQVKFNQIDFRKESLLTDILAVEGLKLKHVTLTSSLVRPSDIALLCESQVDIEGLMLPNDNIGSVIFTNIVSHLPNLKELDLHTYLFDLLPFLVNLPRLETLRMFFVSLVGQLVELLDLSAWRNPNLLHLSLVGFLLKSQTLLAFFKSSPNIRTLTLNFSCTIDIHDVLVIAGQLKELRELSDLTLDRCVITDNDMLLLVPFMNNLTALTFSQMLTIGVPSGQLVVQRCPKLEKLTVIRCPFFDQFVPQRSSVRVYMTPCPTIIYLPY